MILERKATNNISDLRKQYGAFMEKLQINAPDKPGVTLLDIAALIQVYNGAMKTISAKLEVLDDEFQISHNHNPIHHLECRIKGIQSIYEKIRRYDVPFTLESVREYIQDIAGIRVICNFIDDIYVMESLLVQQPDITVVKRKNYIEQPKQNGYRSLHLVVKVPVFLSGRTENVPVEIQLRTIAMDYWASLEHMLRYKNSKTDMKQYFAMLLDCANSLADTEKTMQKIRMGIEN